MQNISTFKHVESCIILVVTQRSPLGTTTLRVSPAENICRPGCQTINRGNVQWRTGHVCCATTLCDGHVVEAVQGHGGVGAPQQSQGVCRQGRGVRVIGRIGVPLQKTLGFGHGHLLLLPRRRETIAKVTTDLNFVNLIGNISQCAAKGLPLFKRACGRLEVWLCSEGIPKRIQQD